MKPTRSPTFTIQNAGIVTNNTAFQMDKSKDGDYYINNTQEWFLVRGTDLNTSNPDNSHIWWFNGYNGPQGDAKTSPNHSLTDNGTTYLLWNMKNTANLNGKMDFNSPTILLSSNGSNFINCVGLTSTSGQSTISDIGYYATYEAAATYPVLMETLDYTAESLTAEIKNVLSQAIQDAQAAIQDDVVQSEAKTAVENAINVAQGFISTGDATNYTTAFNTLGELRGVVEIYENTVVAYSYKTTDYGIQARLNDQYVHIMLYADDIVRVVKGYTEDIAKKSLSVVDTPQSGLCEVAEDTGNKTVTVSTSKVKVVYHLATGQVEVLRYNGAELLREKAGGTSFFAKKDGPFDSYQITSTFQLEDDEQIYGMGQIQDGNLNRRGHGANPGRQPEPPRIDFHLGAGQHEGLHSLLPVHQELCPFLGQLFAHHIHGQRGRHSLPIDRHGNRLLRALRRGRQRRAGLHARTDGQSPAHAAMELRPLPTK